MAPSADVGSPPPGSSHTQQPLSEAINAATRAPHAKLNRLIMSRLPLALPPHASSPTSYVTALLHLVLVFETFESAWECIIYSRSAYRSDGDTQKDRTDCHFAYDPAQAVFRHVHFEADTSGGSVCTSPGSDLKAFSQMPSSVNCVENAPLIQPRVRNILTRLWITGLARTSALYADLISLTGWSLEEIAGQLEAIRAEPAEDEVNWVHEFRMHIRRAVNSKPHVVMAYAWVFYMAMFSGGRYVRSALEGAGPNFWGATGKNRRSLSCCESTAAGRVCSGCNGTNGGGTAHALPLKFFYFNTPQDGLELKEVFKKHLTQAETQLTKNERDDVIQEAVCIFESMALLVGQLDAVCGDSEQAAAHATNKDAASRASNAVHDANVKLRSVRKTRVSFKDEAETRGDGANLPSDAPTHSDATSSVPENNGGGLINRIRDSITVARERGNLLEHGQSQRRTKSRADDDTATATTTATTTTTGTPAASSRGDEDSTSDRTVVKTGAAASSAVNEPAGSADVTVTPEAPTAKGPVISEHGDRGQRRSHNSTRHRKQLTGVEEDDDSDPLIREPTLNFPGRPPFKDVFTKSHSRTAPRLSRLSPKSLVFKDSALMAADSPDSSCASTEVQPTDSRLQTPYDAHPVTADAHPVTLSHFGQDIQKYFPKRSGSHKTAEAKHIQFATTDQNPPGEHGDHRPDGADRGGRNGYNHTAEKAGRSGYKLTAGDKAGRSGYNNVAAGAKAGRSGHNLAATGPGPGGELGDRRPDGGDKAGRSGYNLAARAKSGRSGYNLRGKVKRLLALETPDEKVAGGPRDGAAAEAAAGGDSKVRKNETVADGKEEVVAASSGQGQGALKLRDRLTVSFSMTIPYHVLGILCVLMALMLLGVWIHSDLLGSKA